MNTNTTKSFVVHYKNSHREQCATRIYKGIMKAQREAMARKIKYGTYGRVYIIGFDTQGHRLLEQQL